MRGLSKLADGIPQQKANWWIGTNSEAITQDASAPTRSKLWSLSDGQIRNLRSFSGRS